MVDFEDRKFDANVYDEHYFNNGFEDTVTYDHYENCDGILGDLALMISDIMAPRVTDMTHLDVGAAYGILGSKMGDNGWFSEGFEVSEYAVTRALQLYPDTRIWQGDAILEEAWEEASLDNDEKYGLVTANYFFEHIPTSHVDFVLGQMAERSEWGFFLLECLTSPDEDPMHVHNEDYSHLNCHRKEWWVETLSKFGVLDWDAMFEFGCKSYNFNAELTWQKNCFIIQFNK